MSPESQRFIPIGILFIVAIVIAVAALLIPSVIGKKRSRTAIKDAPYECGLPTQHDTTRFSVKFYLVAMLFILFDIEVVFMMGWATVYRDLIKPVTEGGLGHSIFWAALLFIAILEVGHFYIWRRGALDWTSRPKKHGQPLQPNGKSL